MSVIYKFLFPSKPDGTAMSLLLLALRILFGVLLMLHGVQKWANLFTGFYLRIPLPPCYDSHDFHNEHGIFCDSR